MNNKQLIEAGMEILDSLDQAVYEAGGTKLNIKGMTAYE